MLKSFFCFFTSLFASEQPIESITSFLDKEQRPGAHIVTESFVDFGLSSQSVDIKGVLGAIKSERNPGFFVAFSGAELMYKNFWPSTDKSENFSFEIRDVKNVKILSLHLVLKDKSVYGLDLELSGAVSSKNFELQFSDFKESFRGRIGDSQFEGGQEQIEAVRFFLKRSENLPQSSEPLEFSFSLVVGKTL